MEVVASLSQGRTAASQCGLYTHKSVPVIFEPLCMNMWLVLITEKELFESGVHCSCLWGWWGWMESGIYKRKVATQDEFLARIFDAAARIKKREDQLRRITRHLHTRVAKCLEVGGGILENLLCAVINLSFKH